MDKNKNEKGKKKKNILINNDINIDYMSPIEEVQQNTDRSSGPHNILFEDKKVVDVFKDPVAGARDTSESNNSMLTFNCNTFNNYYYFNLYYFRSQIVLVSSRVPEGLIWRTICGFCLKTLVNPKP